MRVYLVCLGDSARKCEHRTGSQLYCSVIYQFYTNSQSFSMNPSLFDTIMARKWQEIVLFVVCMMNDIQLPKIVLSHCHKVPLWQVLPDPLGVSFSAFIHTYDDVASPVCIWRNEYGTVELEMNTEISSAVFPYPITHITMLSILKNLDSVMQVFRQLPEFQQFEYNSSYFQQLGMVRKTVKSVYFRQFDVWWLASLVCTQHTRTHKPVCMYPTSPPPHAQGHTLH